MSRLIETTLHRRIIHKSDKDSSYRMRMMRFCKSLRLCPKDNPLFHLGLTVGGVSNIKYKNPFLSTVSNIFDETYSAEDMMFTLECFKQCYNEKIRSSSISTLSFLLDRRDIIASRSALNEQQNKCVGILNNFIESGFHKLDVGSTIESIKVEDMIDLLKLHSFMNDKVEVGPLIIDSIHHNLLHVAESLTPAQQVNVVTEFVKMQLPHYCEKENNAGNYRNSVIVYRFLSLVLKDVWKFQTRASSKEYTSAEIASLLSLASNFGLEASIYGPDVMAKFSAEECEELAGCLPAQGIA
jgi:hypothetical protein